MFRTRLHRGRRFLCTAGIVAAGLTWSGTAAAQSAGSGTQGPLEHVRRLNEIASQKAEAEVHAAVQEADRQSAKDRPAAIAKLNAVLTQVENEPDLSSDRRDGLVRLLKVKIRFLEITAGRTTPTSNGGAIGAQRRLEQDRREQDDATISRTLEEIRSMRRDGRFEEARALADDLAKRFPTNPAISAMAQTSVMADAVAKNHARQSAFNQGANGMSLEMQKSATPVARDVDFPKDWQERVKNRNRGTPLTENEKAILRSLDTAIAVRFRGEPFEQAIKQISELMKQPILVDRQALEEALVKYETPVTLETPVTGLSARMVLRRLLADHGLAYVIKDQCLEVTSALKAKNTMVVRSYFIGDLLNNPSLAAALGQPQWSTAIAGAQWWAAPVNQTILAQQVEQIMDMIKTSVEPRSWGAGEGTISFNAATMSLVIRNSSEVHGMLSAGLLR